MPCFHPLEGFAKVGGGLTFKRSQSNGNELTVPCGQCIGCRIEQSRQWAVRIMHEAQLHEENMFLTLTYAPEHLPRHGGLQPEDFVKFMKRYRKEIAPQRIRFFQCGEYGERLSRPHHHAVIFGHVFGDLCEVRPGLQSSSTLERLWGKGFCTIGEVTLESSAYVARYVTKKITGPRADQHYQTMDLQTGEVHNVRPEYCTMSRRPGVGRDWYEQFKGDVHNHDYVIHKGKKMRSPRYYDRLLEEQDESKFQRIKHKRRKAAKLHSDNNTDERLAIREEVLRAKLKHFKRGLETNEA